MVFVDASCSCTSRSAPCSMLNAMSSTRPAWHRAIATESTRVSQPVPRPLHTSLRLARRVVRGEAAALLLFIRRSRSSRCLHSCSSDTTLRNTSGMGRETFRAFVDERMEEVSFFFVYLPIEEPTEAMWFLRPFFFPAIFVKTSLALYDALPSASAAEHRGSVVCGGVEHLVPSLSRPTHPPPPCEHTLPRALRLRQPWGGGCCGGGCWGGACWGGACCGGA